MAQSSSVDACVRCLRAHSPPTIIAPHLQHGLGERLRSRRAQLANEQQEQEGVKGYVQQQRERLKMELDKLRKEQGVVEAAARQHRTVAEKVRGGDSWGAHLVLWDHEMDCVGFVYCARGYLGNMHAPAPRGWQMRGRGPCVDSMA